MFWNRMNNSICFISHPYHRGGVTQWMAHAYNSWNSSLVDAFLITVKPIKRFISSGGRPLLLDLLNEEYSKHVYTTYVSYDFELGTIEYKANAYRKLILEYVSLGVPMIPSDDEACWLAAAAVSKRNPFYAIIHSHGDDEYYRLLKIYQGSICGVIAVSKRVAERIRQEIPSFPEDRILINPCGLFVSEFNVSSYSRSDTVVWIGRMEEKSKRVSDIPKILERLADSPRYLNFKIIGQGEMYAYLTGFIDTFESKNISVELLGWLNKWQIKEVLATSKVLLQTSNYEGMSVSVMEALASGCSVVSSRVSGVEDFEKMKESEDILYLYEIGDVRNAAALIANAIDSHNFTSAGKSEDFAVKYFDIGYRNMLLMEFFIRLNKMSIEVNELTISNNKVFLSGLLSSLRLLKFNLLKIFSQQAKIG